MFKQKCSNTWLSSASTASEFVQIFEKSRQNYESKAASRSEGLSEAIEHWKSASSRVQHYSEVISNIVSSHPEYAAIVWGAFGFLFQVRETALHNVEEATDIFLALPVEVTLNHEELSIKLAQAFAEIGSVLPEIDFIANVLYPTQRIQETSAHVYAYIIEFCILATKWYTDVSRSKRWKMWHAFANPWPLKFEGIKTNIDAYSKRLREQSSLANQAEIRMVHAQVTEIRSALCGLLSPNPLGNLLERRAASSSTAGMPAPLTIEQVFLVLEDIPLNPAEALKMGMMMRDRRRARGRAFSEMMWTSPKVQQWVSSPDSALLRVEGSFDHKEAALDFALDMIEIVKVARVPTIWYLGMSTDDKPASMTDVLRSLIRQLMDQAPDIVSKAGLTSDEGSRTRGSTEDWLRLFVAIGASLPRLVVFIDARKETDAVLGVVSRFKEELDRQNVSVVCKVAVLTCEVSPQMASDLSARWAGHYGELVVSGAGSSRRTRVSYAPRNRAHGSRVGRGAADDGRISFEKLWNERSVVDVSGDDGTS